MWVGPTIALFQRSAVFGSSNSLQNFSFCQNFSLTTSVDDTQRMLWSSMLCGSERPAWPQNAPLHLAKCILWPRRPLRATEHARPQHLLSIVHACGRQEVLTKREVLKAVGVIAFSYFPERGTTFCLFPTRKFCFGVGLNLPWGPTFGYSQAKRLEPQKMFLQLFPNEKFEKFQIHMERKEAPQKLPVEN